MQKVSYKYRQFLFFLIKLSIVIGAFYFIYKHTVHNKTISLSEFFIQLEQTFSRNYYVLFLILIFTFFNWFFEILKWKTLVFSIKNISLFEAAKQSLGSHTASLFTPNRIGEYGAKAMYFKKSNRKKVLLLNLISNVSQMAITVFFGFFGFVFIAFYFNDLLHFPVFKTKRLIYYFAFLIIGLISGKYFISKKIRGFYLNKIITFIKNLSKKLVLKTLLFSAIRFLIFSHQFYYLLVLFGVQTDYLTVIMLIFSMYLIASVIPGLPMFDWLIKGSVAVFIFSEININELVVVSITTLMWLLNFALPAIFGSYFVLNFKFTTK